MLVTGGTRGIGLALATRLADAAGAKVVLVGRGTPSGALPPGAVVVAADVTDQIGLTTAVVPHGPFTAVVHAAGVLADGAIGKVDPLVGASARRVKIDGLVNAVAAAGSPPVVARDRLVGRSLRQPAPGPLRRRERRDLPGWPPPRRRACRSWSRSSGPGPAPTW